MQIDSQVTQIFLLLIEKESFLSKPSILLSFSLCRTNFSTQNGNCKRELSQWWRFSKQVIVYHCLKGGFALPSGPHGEGWAFQEFSELHNSDELQHEVCSPTLLHSKCELLCTNSSTAAWAQSSEFYLPVVKTGHSCLFGHFICLFICLSYCVNLRCLRSLWDKKPTSMFQLPQQ